ncbi:DNA-binding protein [Flavobacterium arcticum]|uniref:CD-NTase-associated protein 12 n=1 Tax=Flavobacterium arcticum TaxID=1784713 RepID=A0A345HAE9_9FLAO|nr:STING domain-containing protein [Flavobacterium arcticum]AXG73559.1 DNA-binding protein [Flavobacterium arcticum]KAF2513351.1 nucleotide-binding protein [Flavobacterium arcticum]
MKKKKIFIGCSSEEIKIAKIVEGFLDKDYEVTIWDEKIWDKAVFRLNNNFLNDLLKASLKFDFGILIGTPDDKLIKRGNEVLSARDNILFELGLFIGRLGIDKCAFLVDSSVEVPTDLSGIYIAKYNIDNITDKIKEVKQLFDNSSINKFNFFPSNTLAFGYFENFIKPLCNEYYKKNQFDIEGIKYSICSIQIMIPKTLSEDLNLQFQQIKNKIGVEEKCIPALGRRRNYNVDVKKLEKNQLEILDFPSTLTGINYAIRELLPDEYNENGEEYKQILNRELERFVHTLQSLIKRNGFDGLVSIKYN